MRYASVPADGQPQNTLDLAVQAQGAKKDAAFFDDAVRALNDAAVSAGGPARRIVAELAPQSAARQWEEAKRGGECVWERAERVVRSRVERK